MKHTQGTWKVDNSIDYEISVISPWSKENPVETSAVFGDYRGGLICEMHYNTGVPTREQALSNAKLIVAAPELLEALKKIMDGADKNKKVDFFTFDKWCDSIKAAIKKATE